MYVRRQALCQVAEENEPILALATEITERGLSVPVSILLELFRPLLFVGSQLMVMLNPLVSPLIGHVGHSLTELLDDPEQVELLLRALEARAVGESIDAVNESSRTEREGPCHPSSG